MDKFDFNSLSGIGWVWSLLLILGFILSVWILGYSTRLLLHSHTKKIANIYFSFMCGCLLLTLTIILGTMPTKSHANLGIGYQGATSNENYRILAVQAGSVLATKGGKEDAVYFDQGQANEVYTVRSKAAQRVVVQKNCQKPVVKNKAIHTVYKGPGEVQVAHRVNIYLYRPE
ncbi:hypothetical protein [Ligilactobacillus acidipiscis]|uniref:hypothetical protein n=1 Tax=Ligilactobacillus acidipiscis TaxID=89059 RepID=UPI0023F895D8|nr:hypothetical protein [Ligilactobacillus acidipiscis]WEV58138.1 hypothetical protein OZX66_12455 [Ligilactobacillus acidipiscis]